jgi:beta-mannosidase
MQTITLTDGQWQLKGYWPWVPLKVSSMELGQELMGVTDWMPATVPGGVHYDLYRAKLIDHPWYELNSLKCEWVENRWWVYRTTFVPPAVSNGSIELICQGLDYEAQLFLGNRFLGAHKGMYHPAVFDITEDCKAGEPLELLIMFKHAPDEMSQIGKTSLTYTQKSRFNYKWDFSTRLVNIGIWDEICLRVHDAYSLQDIAVTSDVDVNGVGRIDVSTGVRSDGRDVHDLSMKVVITGPDGRLCKEAEVEASEEMARTAVSFSIEEAQLWYPNGYGEQPMYEVQVTLLAGDRAVDTKHMNTGIRSLSYIQNEESPKDALPYTFVVNGKRIYIQGVNMTPLDHLYGNVLPTQYAYMVEKIKNANINMIRVWGGGLIEKEVFYDLCDQHGIMVWQEFIQSSSGVDNIPSQGDEFLRLLSASAVEALKVKRNHVSLTVWSGGNELMSAPNRPSTYDDENLAMLKKLVEQYDPQRLFLPTSASGPVEFVTREKGVSHDVHGHWKYQGNPGQYELYSDVDNLFHSEFGVDGVSATKSLRKFLSQGECRPISMEKSLVWRHHGEWWDTWERDTKMFGELTDIEHFSDASQWIQAEGLRFVLEANRRRQFRNSGSIIWQVNEPFPNASCTNLIDYYGESKMAYYWTRRAFSPYHVSAEYRKLDWAVGEVLEAKLYINGIRATEDLTVISSVINRLGEVVYEQKDTGSIDGDHACQIGRLQVPVTAEFGELFLVRLTLLSASGDSLFANDYFFSTQKEHVYGEAFRFKAASQVVTTAVGDWEAAAAGGDWLRAEVRTYRIVNQGAELALHIRATELTNGYWLEASDNYFTLLPGEQKDVVITCYAKQVGGFLADDVAWAKASCPVVGFRCFG